LAEIRQNRGNQPYPDSGDNQHRQYHAGKNRFVAEELLCQVQQGIVMNIPFIAIPGVTMILSVAIGMSVMF
jgi:hypothetical protein